MQELILSDNHNINKTKTRQETAKVISKYFFLSLKYVILGLFVITVFLPIIPILFGSLKDGNEFFASGVLDFPKSWKWNNYKTAFIDGNMLTGFINTLIIMIVSLAVSVLTGAMTSYVLHRFVFKGQKVVKNLFLLATLIPNITNNIATFQIISWLNLFNTRWAGILLFSGTDIISVYIMMQFLDSISKSMDESAMIDGASYLRIFLVIIFPLLMPAIITVFIIKGVAIYNDFVTPFLFMPSPDLAMISTALYNFKGPFAASWEIISAGVILITLPMLASFVVMQKWIYNGLVMGSVKE
ncbi:MAG TPA: carbohydrate ABC transporter permease [Clostridia bacterium]